MIASIKVGRIDILSMEEEQPAMQGTGEVGWSQNRRDALAPMIPGTDR